MASLFFLYFFHTYHKLYNFYFLYIARIKAMLFCSLKNFFKKFFLLPQKALFQFPIYCKQWSCLQISVYYQKLKRIIIGVLSHTRQRLLIINNHWVVKITLIKFPRPCKFGCSALVYVVQGRIHWKWASSGFHSIG